MLNEMFKIILDSENYIFLYLSKNRNPIIKKASIDVNKGRISIRSENSFKCLKSIQLIHMCTRVCTYEMHYM